MCFSAEASFGSSAVLLVVSIASLKKSAGIPQKMLACVPLFFCVQQFSEGMLWLSLTNSSLAHLQKGFTYFFLLFAQVIWPSFVPLIVLLLEPSPKRRKLFAFFLGIGILVSSYLAFCLICYPVAASVEEHHIRYKLDFPLQPMRFVNFVYFLPTVPPALISSLRGMKLLGVAILVSYIISRIFYQPYVVSVWCYFAAAISIIALGVIIRLNRKK